jgi:sugar lactone lactonase YvrE
VESSAHRCSPLFLATAIAIISDLVPLIVVAATLFGFTLTASANEIVTIAGNGTDGFSGDGADALAAEIGGISGMAVDAGGNLYFADTWNQRVRMVAITGVVSTVAGNGVIGEGGDGGPAGSASLLWPAGVAVDANGNVYISSGSRVRKVSSGGTIAAFAGITTAGYAGDGGAATSAQLTEPHGLAVDSAGNLYIADSGNFRIRKVDRNGIITTIAGTGVAGYSGDGGPAVSAEIGYVHALAFDAAGNLYFSDPYNHCVRKILTNGTVKTAAGGAFGSAGDGGAAVGAELKYPYGLAVDRSGSVYVADLLNQRVRVIAADGTIFTAAGTGSAGFNGDGQPGPYTSLNMPAELALAPTGSIYIADLRNFRIRELVTSSSPPAPTLLSPADGATGVALAPALNWDASSGATSYDVYFGTSSPPPLVATTTGTSYAPGTLTAATLYFWQVLARNSSNSNISATWSFTTQGTPPAAPVLSLPADGATGVSVAPTLTWNVSAGAASYEVYFGTSSAPSLVATTAGTSYAPGTLSADTTYYWRIVAQNGVGAAGSATWAFTTGVAAIGLRFVPVAPCRVADTRGAAGPFGGPTMAAASTRSFAIPQSACGIPSTAQGYSLNVTVVPEGPLSYLTLWPSGQPQPLVSTLNSFGGIVVANAAAVPAGTGGAVSVYVTGPTDVILDIDGYFDTSSGTDSYSFYPATPCRVADTRGQTGQFGGPSMFAGQTRDFPIPLGSCDIPATARAYSLNVTVVPATDYLGYLTTWPTGQPQPLVSTLNSWTGKVVANAALVPAGTNESVSVFVTDPTDVILDVNGYFGLPENLGALSFYPVTPCRVADTRNADGPFGGPEMEAGETRSFAIPASGCPVPSTAAAYSVNVTVVPDGALSYLTAWPAGSSQPLVSTLNSFDGSVVANAAIVPAGTSGAISIFVTQPTHVILDINGYFAP